MKSSEFKIKLTRLRGLLRKKSLKGILLSTRANFSWLTCGQTNQVRTDIETGVASLWVTNKGVELWTSTIEESRFQTEETANLPLKYRTHPWWRDDQESWIPSGRVGSDNGFKGTLPLKNEITALRSPLLAEEIKRYRYLGKLSGEAMEEVAGQIRVGWTEQQAAFKLSEVLLRRGLQPDVVLVGADERLRKFRHPIPKSNRIRKIVMLVACAEYKGLIASLTRLIHFGKLPEELKRLHHSCLQVECALLNATRPGVEAGRVFKAGITEYARQGYKNEWAKHHQGGPAGYDTRDYLGRLGEKRKILKNQAVAWNPSITGTKSEDTILVREKGLEVLTRTPHWPVTKINYGGRVYLRPAILEKKKKEKGH